MKKSFKLITMFFASILIFESHCANKAGDDQELINEFAIIFDQDWLNIENSAAWDLIVSIRNLSNPNRKIDFNINLDDLLYGISFAVPANNNIDVSITAMHPSLKTFINSVVFQNLIQVNFENPKSNIIYRVYKNKERIPTDKKDVSIDNDIFENDAGVVEENLTLSDYRNKISKAITEVDDNWEKTPPGITNLIAHCLI